MTHEQFWNNDFTQDQYEYVCTEVAAIRVHDYDCEYVDWQKIYENALRYYPNKET